MGIDDGLSFLLVGHYAERATSRRAATTGASGDNRGGLAMLVGIIMLGQLVGSYNLSDVVANPASGWLASVAIVGAHRCAVESAIVPLHFW